MAHPVVHFEIAANDLGKLQRFYTDLLGWKFESAPEYPGYMMIQTAAEGVGIDGGMMQKQMPQQGNINYARVESVDEYSKKATSLGGQVVVGKMAVPKMGYFAVVLDPEGNPVGLWEDDPSAA